MQEWSGLRLYHGAVGETMDSLKLGGPKPPAPPAPAGSTGAAQYIQDAQTRLRRLTESLGPVQAPIDPVEVSEERRAVATPQVVDPPALLPERAADVRRGRPAPTAPPAPISTADELRASVLDRVVDKVAERVLEDWKRNADDGNLSEQIAARVVERLLERLGE